jgi:hypothetical protein
LPSPATSAYPSRKRAPWKEIGQAHLQDGNRSDGQAHLRQALAIYQRIGAPAVLRVKDTLRQHRL